MRLVCILAFLLLASNPIMTKKRLKSNIVSIDTASSAAVAPQLPRMKCRKPGKKPPVRGSASGQGQRSDDEHVVDDGEPGPSGAHTSWAERMIRKDGRWKEVLPGMKQDYLLHYPVAAHYRQQDTEQQLANINARIGSSWSLHKCPAMPDEMPARTDFEAVPGYEVTYYSLSCVGRLTVQGWQCKCCQQQMVPMPCMFGCFPNSPTAPTVWYDLQVLKLYHRLGPMEGLSATGAAPCIHASRTNTSGPQSSSYHVPLDAGFLEGLLNVHQLWTDSPGNNITITANSFEDTFCAYLSVVTDLDSLSSLGVEGMDSGPFCDCAVCAHLPSGNVGN
jgi:hypothetical protein